MKEAYFLRGQRSFSGYLTEADGQAGLGVYAFLPSDGAMRRYYTSRGETLVRIIPLGSVIDLRKHASSVLASCKEIGIKASQGNWWIQPYGIARFMADHFPDAAGFMVPHKGIGIPSGVQVVLKPWLIEFSVAD